MASIPELISACTAALKSAPGLLKEIQAHRLTREQEDLLVKAQKIGSFHVFDFEQCLVPIVRAGTSTFAEPEDVAACTRYYEAFLQLCERGYVRHQSDKLFTLTDAGRVRAGRLSAE